MPTAGWIADENRFRCPVASSVRLSLTLGCWTGTAPARARVGVEVFR